MGMPPPPPAPGSAADAPSPPGSVPRLSLAAGQDKAAPPPVPKGLQIRVAESQTKVGGKPVVKPGVPGKPGKPPAAVLRKRPALSIVAKVGIAVLVLAVTIGGFFFYRIFFPPPSRVVKIDLLPIAKPVVKPAADILAKVAAEPVKLADDGEAALAARRAAEQAKLDAAANPTPAPADSGQAVMAESNISKDVKVDNTPIVAAKAASPEFRTFVANASIGGVFQGTPSKAIINGRIVRESQVIDSQLGITFDRIDVFKKMIYFKDGTGAEVSKSY
jgi:hypothetical protein